MRDNLVDIFDKRGQMQSHINLCLPQRDQFIDQDPITVQNGFYKTNLGSYS
jgi:hypothetical protein